MKKKTNKIILGLVVFFLLCYILDCLIKSQYITFILVTENYNDTIFAAIITIAALSSALISIIISVISNKCYGFSYRELLSMSPKGDLIRRSIPYTLIICLVSIFFYAFFFLIPSLF